MKIAAGIVVYAPDVERLAACVQSICIQMEHIYFFDNTPQEEKNEQYILFVNNLPARVTYISENVNRGIAYALNCIMRAAKRDNYSWIITMDQDSVMPMGIVSDYQAFIEKSREKIGIICPQVIDKRRCYMEIEKEPEWQYIEDCITSASCTSVEAWEQIGEFDEWLFIDLVDNEFCKRLIVSNYKIVRLNKWVLDQEFGKIIPKSEKQQHLWLKVSKLLHNPNFAKFSYKKYVSPLRVYYTNRNIIYVNRKLKKYGKVGYQNYNCKGYVGFLISFSLPSFLRAQNKMKVLWAIVKGMIDGSKTKPELWECINLK